MTSLGETYEIHKILCKSGPRATKWHKYNNTCYR